MEISNRSGQSASGGGGIILVLLGTLFLLQQVVDFDIGRIFWPFFVIIPGLLCLSAMAFGGKGSSWLAVPGTIVTTVGCLLLLQALTDRYETWAYAWALAAPLAVGVGTLLIGLRDGVPSQVATGRTLIGIGLGLFLAFGAFFELLIFRGSAVAETLWPLALIAVGIVLLFAQVWRPART
jgi:hypothetical protein